MVTGGARDIEATIATRLAFEEYNIAIIDIDEEAGRMRENKLISKGLKAVFIKADVSIEHNVMKAVEYVFNKYNSINVLVNNAGIGFTGRSIEEQTLEE
nr:SDR family NAD(P)-dependent oxidoreductase [Desulfurococcus amylolyticus]